MTSRRGFLRSLAVLGAASASPLKAQPPRFASYPFSLGVASGYPSADGVVLWTRLTGVDPVAMTMHWELAADEAMNAVLLSGTQTVEPAWAH